MSGLRLSCVSPVSPVALVALVALAVGACAGPPPEAAPPASPAVRSAALSQGCDCADGSWDVVDQGSAATLNVSGKSLCIDSGTFSGQLQMDAATRVCVDDDAAFVSPQALNLGGRFENWGVAGTALTPFSFSAVEGTVIDNHGAMHIATANFNGRADITNAVDATIDFTTSFSLRNRSTMTNRGTFRAVSNFDTSADSVFVNEGYGYITGQLSFEGVSENHGLLEITAKVNVNGTAAFANTCTIVSHGTYNVNGAYANDGLVYLTADSEDVVFNVTGGGSMTQGASGTVFVTSADGVLAGPLHANLRVDGGIRGGGQIYVEDETVCQGSGVVSGTPEAPLALFDATPTGLADGRLLDIQTGTLSDVVRGPAPVVPTLLEAQLGVTGSDCRTLVALHCYDDHPPTEIDTGCDATRPWCDIAGEVRRCVACKEDLDCGPGHLCLDGLCENPDPIARDDQLAVAEGGSVAVTRAALGENDANIDIVTLALPGGVTALATLGGGSVVATADGFSYTPAAQGAPAADTFRYAVCGVGTAASICVEAVVTIAINHRPTPGDLDVWVAVGTATVDVDVVPAFSDPDGDGPAADVGVETLAVPEPLVPGVRTVAYTACDDGVPSACGAGEVTVHVNDPPVLGAPEVVSGGGHTVVVPRGAIILGTGVVHGDDVRDGDTDGIGSIAVSGPCALNAAGDLAVTLPPTPGSYGCDVIVCEELPPGSASVCATTTVPIVVADPPLAVDDLYWGLKGLPVAGLVAANDVVDGHGAAGVVILGPAPDPAAQGSVAAAPSGLVTFTPVASFAGSVKVVYRLSDGLGQSDTATITFIVNDPPVLAAPTVELPPAGHGAIPLAEVITGTGLVKGDDPSDGDTDGLGAISIETGANVCALVGADVALTAPTGPGHFTCRLRVCEELPLAPPAGPGAACSTTTITVIVPGATPPTAGDDAFYGAQGASLGGSVLGNDAVDTVHGGAPTVTLLGPTPDATDVGVVSEAGGVVTLTPVASFAGVVTVLYQLDDGLGQSATATVTFTVNDPPHLDDPTLTVYPGEPATLPVSDLVLDTGLVHGDDPGDGDSDGIGSVTVSGDACSLADGVITATAPAAPGTATCEVTVCEERPAGAPGVCATTTVSVVRPEPPTASDDAVTTPEDHAVTVDVGVNDDDALEVVAIATPPTHGVASVDESGTITYTPSGDFHGSDSFAYRSCDAHDQCATATVTVSVTPVPDAPIANDDAATTPNATPVTLDLLANDIDPDGDALTVTNVTNPAHGTVTLAGVYTPAEGFDGIDGFDYTACDASGLCDTAHATITVGQGVNHGPVGHDDTATVDEDGHATIDVIDNDVDPDGDNLDVTEVSDPDHGTAVVDADGNITYTPDPDYAGEDDFTYVVCDTEGACATVSVTITVTPENDAPVAIDDHATTPKDTPVTIAALANDFDPDGDPLSVDGVDLPTGMDLVTNADGTFTFTPAAGFVGTTSFRYVVADPGGLTDDAIVTIDVSDTTTPNHAPEAADDSATVATDGTVTVPVTANDQDADGDALVVTAVVQPEHGTVVIGEDGAVSYTPDPGFVGSDSFSYTVSDGHGGSDSATVTVTVVDDGTGFEGVVAEGGGGCAAGGLEPGWLAAAAGLLAGLARRRRRV